MQLDHPIKTPRSLQDSHLEDLMQNIPQKPPQDLQSLASVLEFMTNLLAKSVDLQMDMIECDGFAILGVMFQWFSPSNWVFQLFIFF